MINVCEPRLADRYFPAGLLHFQSALPPLLGGRRSGAIDERGMEYLVFHAICDVLVGLS